jgi:hypothetical protein
MLPKMNASISPCEDFWSYACGGWLKDHELPPAARSKWDRDEEMAFRSESLFVTGCIHGYRLTLLYWGQPNQFCIHPHKMSLLTMFIKWAPCSLASATLMFKYLLQT